MIDPSASHDPLEDDDELAEIEELIGTDFDGRYRIISELARGGMGIVFRAEHLTLNRPVVIKVLKAAQVGSSSAKARFEREARRACQLDHPNIVTVHDFGYHEDLGYLVMEFVDGITLYDYVRKYGPLNFAQFAPVTAAILSGLAEAHRQGIVHRDIKASNIMMTFDNGELRRVKILDFGLAKAEGAVEDNVTRQSALVGTMGAMPPERILCKPTDCRVDLYALGICCYRLVSGRRPFVGEDMHVLYQHVHEHPAPLTERLAEGHDYPIMVLEWIHRLLAKEPDDRPRDASQAREWLFETLSDTSVFRVEDSKDVSWMEKAKHATATDFAGKSGTFEVSDTSWSNHTSPSGSFRSVISPDSARRAVEEMHAENEKISEDEEIEPAVKKSKAGLWGIGVVAIVAMLAVAGAIASSSSEDSNAGVAVTDPPSTNNETSVAEPNLGSDNLEEVFVRIETSLEKGSYATAENLLQSIQDKLGSNTDLQVKAAEFQARIDIDKYLRKARQLETDLQIEEAIEQYDAVLSLDANNGEAKERHSELSSKIVLKVSSDPMGAGVYIDGKRLGDTPLEALTGLNFSVVEVRKPNYETWSASLVPRGGTSVELAAQLDKRRRREVIRTPDRKEDEKGIDDETLMGMGN